MFIKVVITIKFKDYLNLINILRVWLPFGCMASRDLFGGDDDYFTCQRRSLEIGSGGLIFQGAWRT